MTDVTQQVTETWAREVSRSFEMRIVRISSGAHHLIGRDAGIRRLVSLHRRPSGRRCCFSSRMRRPLLRGSGALTVAAGEFACGPQWARHCRCRLWTSPGSPLSPQLSRTCLALPQTWPVSSKAGSTPMRRRLCTRPNVLFEWPGGPSSVRGESWPGTDRSSAPGAMAVSAGTGYWASGQDR